MLCHLVEDVAQALVLLLAVGKDVYPVALEDVVFKGAEEQVEVLVEQRLRRGVECYRGLWRARGTSAELNPPEGSDVFGERGAGYQRVLRLHLLHDDMVLHLRGPFEALGDGLLRESLAVGVLYHVVDERHVFHCHERVPGQELEEAYLLGDESGKLRHDTHAVHLLARELCLHFKGSYGIHLVAEEVNAVGVFVAERIHVEDAAPDGKLPRLVDIVHLLEAECAHRLLHLHDVLLLAHAHAYRAVVEVLV